MLSGFDHLVVKVHDIGRAVDFYSRVLGLDVHYLDQHQVDLMLGDTALRLTQPPSAPLTDRADGNNHGRLELCLRCRIPLEQFIDHLKVLDIAIEAGPIEQAGVHGRLASVALRDPDGNLIEVARPLP